MEEILSLNPLVVTGICNPSKSRARHHRSMKLGSKLKYLNKLNSIFEKANEYFRKRLLQKMMEF